jgi:hypothetical protein
MMCLFILNSQTNVLGEGELEEVTHGGHRSLSGDEGFGELRKKNSQSSWIWCNHC